MVRSSPRRPLPDQDDGAADRAPGLHRNRRVGVELARGRSLADIIASTPMIAEGVETCGAAVALGAKYGVDLPIICQMDAVLHRGKTPHEAIRDLMERSLKGE